MAKLAFSTKRLQINKANATMITVVAITSFVVIFSLVAIRALAGQRAYQGRVIKEKTIAKNQLDANIKATETLAESYQNFIQTSENLLGGNPNGTGELDGDNAKLILDALPSKYDAPALAASLEKILSDKNYKIEDINVVDNEVQEQTNVSSPNPQAVDVPFEITVKGSYPALQKLVSDLQRSIRPFQIQTLDFSGDDSELKVKITGKTFYQPEKNLNITTKEVK